MSRLRILLADDEMHVRLIIKAYLAPYDTEIIEVRNGSEALRFLGENPVDLLILDYSMPVMSGGEALEIITKDPKMKSIPVIVYTAGGFDLEREKWLKRNSAGFLEKVSLGDDLIPTVMDILGPRLQKKI